MPLKSGDDERIRIMMMVKEGKISIDGALQTAYGLGVASTPYEDMDDLNKTQAKRRKYGKTGVHNFGVLKYSRSNISTKCVLQIDFQEQVFCLIVRGTTQEQRDFFDLKGVDTEDGSTRLSIFLLDATELDLDAGSLEEKNKVVRLLNVILQGNNEEVEEIPGETSAFDEAKELRVIKESTLEKRGHSAAFLVWAKRFVRVKHGELCYFKPGEERNADSALCVIPLKHGLTLTKKLDHNGFVIITDKKEYNFRIPSSLSKLQSDIEKERDDWIIAIQEGARPSRIQHTTEPKANLADKDVNELAAKQEHYLRSVIGTLQEELEQLGSILTIIDAPVKASVQVKRVREVVRSLDQEVRTGLLSWNIRAQAQSVQKALVIGREGGAKPSQWNVELEKKADSKKDSLDKRRHYPYTYADTTPANELSSFKSVDASTSDVSKEAVSAPDNYTQTQPKDKNGPISRGRSRNDKERTTVEYANEGVKVTMSDTLPGNAASDVQGQDSSVLLGVKDTADTKGTNLMYAQVNKNRAGDKTNLPEGSTQEVVGDEVPPADETPPPLPPRASSDCYDDVTLSAKEPDGELTTSVEDSSAPKVIPEEPPSSDCVAPIPSPPPAFQFPGLPPPPPPPTGMQGKLPPKATLEPNVKLKQWFWTKIPDGLVPGSVWMDANDRLEAFDVTVLESLFIAEGPKKKVEVVKQASPTVAPKTLLDAKKAQNLGIFLSGFKIKAEDVERKLNILSEEHGLSIEQIISIKRFQPTTEEADLYRNFQGNKEDLSSVDQFLMKMCDVPNLSSRLDLLLTILEFPTLYEEIGPAVEGLVEAYRNLKNSQAFVRLLEYVLSVGNYVNGGTNRGGAYGFKLTSLTKLVDVRSNDKKHTLLKYIVEQLFDKDVEALKCYKEVPALLKPIDISIKGLEGEIDVMKKDLIKVKNIVDRMKGKELTAGKSDESFVKETEDFRNTYQKKLEDMERNCNEIKELALYLKTKFGEPSSNYQEWLNAICEFFKHLEKMVEEEEGKRERLSVKSPLKVNAANGGNADKVTDKDGSRGSGKQLDRPGGIPRKWSGGVGVIPDHHGLHLEGFKNNPLFMAKNADQTVNEKQASETQSSEDSQVPIKDIAKSGYLEKQSGSKHGSSKHKGSKWEKRYFEITANGYLYYYKKRDAKCSGSVYLRGCPIRKSNESPCIFHIDSEERNWTLKAANELEASDWLKILNYYGNK